MNLSVWYVSIYRMFNDRIFYFSVTDLADQIFYFSVTDLADQSLLSDENSVQPQMGNATSPTDTSNENESTKVNIKPENKHKTVAKKSDGKRAWSCRFCDKIFTSRYLRSKHEVIHENQGLWACKLCDDTFDTKLLLLKHKAIHGIPLNTRTGKKKLSPQESAKEWTCQTCGRQCKKKRAYYTHLLHKHPESPELSEVDLNLILKFVCHMCGKKFTSRSGLQEHELIHKGKTVPCPDCGRLFLTMGKMRKHRNTHTDPKSRQNTAKLNKQKSVCSYCGRVFSFAKNCKAHELTHKPKSQLPFHCDYEGCSAAFTLKNSLLNHYNTHTGKREYCPFCEKGFSQKSALRTHIKTMHEHLKPYRCVFENCNAAFSLKVSLKEHMVEHTGQFPYICMWCQKGFKQKGNLKIHVQKRHEQNAAEYM